MISTRCRSYCPHPKKEKNSTQTEGHSFRNRLNSLRTLQAFCLFSSWQPSLQVKARRTWVWVKIWDMDSARNWVGFKYSTSSWGDLHATREAASSRGQRPTRKRSPIPEQQIILIPSVKKNTKTPPFHTLLSLSQQLKPTDHVPLLPFFWIHLKKNSWVSNIGPKNTILRSFQSLKLSKNIPRKSKPHYSPQKSAQCPKKSWGHGNRGPGSSQFPQFHWATRRVSMSSTALRITGKLLITPPTNLGKTREATKKSGCHGRTTRYHYFRGS
jgi:hypothetical protein